MQETRRRHGLNISPNPFESEAAQVVTIEIAEFLDTAPDPRPSTDEIARAAAKANPLSRGFAVLGGYFAFCLDIVRLTFRRPFQLQEFIDQAWFVSSVTIVPTLFVAIPFCVIVVFDINQLLGEIGAVDLAGTGAGLAVIREIGPVVSVLVVAGAGATAICADLGARKIREELDAMTTLGVNPIQRLIVPRVLASTLVAVCLNGLVCVTGLIGGYFFSVYVQNATPGLYVSGLTLLVGSQDFLLSEIKAAVFGLLAGTIACYLGVNAKGGPKGVGDAVNQTVVFSFMALFFANSTLTAVFLQIEGK